jgi:hypothetical protein
LLIAAMYLTFFRIQVRFDYETINIPYICTLFS